MSGRLVALSDYRGTPRLGSAIEAFFSDKQLSTNTRRACSQALHTVVVDLGWERPWRGLGRFRWGACSVRSVSARCHLLEREDSLQQFLAESGSALVWRIIGENSAVGPGRRGKQGQASCGSQALPHTDLAARRAI